MTNYLLRFRAIIISFLIIGSSGLWTSPVTSQENLANNQIIRIALLVDVDDVFFKIRRKYRIFNAENQTLLMEGRNLKLTGITAHHTGLQFGDDFLHTDRIDLVPSNDVTVLIGKNNRRYRGMISVIRNESNRLLVVNTIDVEDYIKGVLYHEVSHRWPIEALKVQAVAARTYAYYRMKVNKEREYDLTNDIYSQVYGGRNSERYRTSIAVNRTRGEIMTYRGEILPAYYSATCGGRTEDVEELWNHKDLTPLRGVRCGFCRHSPHYHWTRNFQSEKIQKALKEKKYDIGLIKDIQILDWNKSGRVKEIVITTRDEKTVTLSGKAFRNLIGPNLIKSNNYHIHMKGYYFDLVGKGWGHGVGMCQWGAHGMAKQRYKYRQILLYYYPGVEFVNLPEDETGRIAEVVIDEES